MKTLHDLYGQTLDIDTRYRSKLKKRIQEVFPDQVMFFQLKNNKSPEVVLTTSVLDANNFFSSN